MSFLRRILAHHLINRKNEIRAFPLGLYSLQLRTLCLGTSSASSKFAGHKVRGFSSVKIQTKWIQDQAPKRHLWAMLNAVFNRPDNNRIKEVGPQRACAEWLLRCGAHVRWEGFNRFQQDYNKLPSGGFDKFRIEEINADDAAVMGIGFPHFNGVDSIRKIRFHHCAYFQDDALEQLGRIKDSLEDLEISSCGDISDRGLESLNQLTNLKSLLLYDLPGVRYKEEALKKLQEALPNCKIDFKDVKQDKTV